jgi:hypothetical protein
MATKLEKQEDLKSALTMLETIHADLKAGGLLSVIIKHTSESNLSYRYDVRLYTVYNDKVQSYYLNWTFATLTGKTRHANGEVKGSGIGFDRAHDVAYTFELLFKQHGLEDLGLPRYEGIF